MVNALAKSGFPTTKGFYSEIRNEIDHKSQISAL